MDSEFLAGDRASLPMPRLTAKLSRLRPLGDLVRDRDLAVTLIGSSAALASMSESPFGLAATDAAAELACVHVAVDRSVACGALAHL